MDNKDKIAKLAKYADGLRDKLSSPTPPKHAAREATYREFLRRDLAATQAKLSVLKGLG